MLDTADEPFSDHAAHAAAHEVKLEAGRHQADVADTAPHDHKCIGLAGVFKCLFQALRIFAAVLELEGVHRQHFLADFVASLGIQKSVQTRARVDAVMVLALRTDVLVLLKVGTVQNGFTARAFDPQALGHGRSAIGCSHSLGRLGRKQFFKPTHGKTPITTAKSPPACRPGGGGIVEPNHPF